MTTEEMKQTVIFMVSDGNNLKIEICREMSDSQMGDRLSQYHSTGQDVNHIIRIPDSIPIHYCTPDTDADWNLDVVYG